MAMARARRTSALRSSGRSVLKYSDAVELLGWKALRTPFTSPASVRDSIVVKSTSPASTARISASGRPSWLGG